MVDGVDRADTGGRIVVLVVVVLRFVDAGGGGGGIGVDAIVRETFV